MMDGVFHPHEDRAWIRENYPKLLVHTSGSREIVEGTFNFIAAYSETEKHYIINPTDIDNPKIIVIQDEYQIRITPPAGIEKLPKVRETDGRIRGLTQEKGIAAIDLHIYPADSLCLVGSLDENRKQSFRDFLDGPVLQFLYDQSYFEKYGRWPRGQYSHGVLGIFENYFDRREVENGKLLEACLNTLQKSRQWPEIKKILFRKGNIKGHWQCPCGSGKKFRDCHENALLGMWCFQSDLKSAPNQRKNLIDLYERAQPTND